MAKILKEYGCRYGRVENITDEKISVILSCPETGPRGHTFPRQFIHPRLNLQPEDEIVCYVIDKNGQPQIQITKMRQTPIDQTTLDAMCEKALRELDELDRKYGEK